MKHAFLVLFAVLIGAIATAALADGGVPTKWMPPGSFPNDPGPSKAIFPPQKMPLRFNHKLHVGAQKINCESCHTKSQTSQVASDNLMPAATTCDGCHGTDHTDPNKVTAGSGGTGQCVFCHVGYQDGDGNKVAQVVVPQPNMIFSHQKHAARNIKCQQCHGDIEQLELATRDQLPRMRGCFECHQKTNAASLGDAKSECIVCHIKGGTVSGNMIQTAFPSGALNPPRWMHEAQHAADFIQRHKMVAAADSKFCANCHKEDFCVDCHDGRIRPKNIHPADYLNMHPVEARLATQRCTSCHNEQTFCLQCHQRLGVSMSGPVGSRDSGRFHPPKSEWSDAPRKPGHHAFEAMRNLNSCVSCHVERDCVVCHGGKGVGGGFNPHNGSFVSHCASEMRRNPRPCMVCHQPGASELKRCQ